MQLPDYIKAKQGPSLVDRALANVGSPRPPHVSIQGNRFGLVDAAGTKQAVQTLYLDVVIFDLLEHKSKMFYDPDKKWTPESADPPLCWSDNGIGPSSQVSPPAEFETGPTCELCPQNRWGSKISAMTGEGIKACRDEQKVAVLIPGFEGVYLLTIPPNTPQAVGGLRDEVQGARLRFHRRAHAPDLQGRRSGHARIRPVAEPVAHRGSGGLARQGDGSEGGRHGDRAAG